MLSQKAIDEYDAVKNNAGLFDFSIEGKIKITGADRIDFINGLVSNDVKKLEENNGIYAAFLDRLGRIISDCIIYKFDDFLLINLSIIGKNNIIKKLIEDSKLSKTNIEDITLKYALLSVQGLKSLEIINKIANNKVNLKQNYECQKINDLIIARNSRANETGFDIFVPVAKYREFKNKILKLNVMQISNEAYNILRLEAQIPLFGMDFNEKNIINEVTEKAISYEKGCFVGQEIVARIKNIAKGMTSKKLVALEINANKNIEKNAKIMKNGKEAGYLTSSAFSPDLNKSVGFGFLYKEFYGQSDFYIVLENQKLGVKASDNLKF